MGFKDAKPLLLNETGNEIVKALQELIAARNNGGSSGGSSSGSGNSGANVDLENLEKSLGNLRADVNSNTSDINNVSQTLGDLKNRFTEGATDNIDERLDDIEDRVIEASEAPQAVKDLSEALFNCYPPRDTQIFYDIKYAAEHLLRENYGIAGFLSGLLVLVDNMIPVLLLALGMSKEEVLDSLSSTQEYFEDHENVTLLEALAYKLSDIFEEYMGEDDE